MFITFTLVCVSVISTPKHLTTEPIASPTKAPICVLELTNSTIQYMDMRNPDDRNQRDGMFYDKYFPAITGLFIAKIDIVLCVFVSFIHT